VFQTRRNNDVNFKIVFLFLSFFLSFDLFLPTHCRCRELLLHLITLNDTHTHTDILCALVRSKRYLPRDLYMEMVTTETGRFARKHEGRLLRNGDFEAIQLLDNTQLLRRLKRTKPFKLVP
jgi:hypothetical protein